MNSEKLMLLEIESQRKLIRLLVEFYDSCAISNDVDCDEEKLEHLSEKIEKEYDLDQHRPSKKKKEEEIENELGS